MWNYPCSLTLLANKSQIDTHWQQSFNYIDKSHLTWLAEAGPCLSKISLHVDRLSCKDAMLFVVMKPERRKNDQVFSLITQKL